MKFTLIDKQINKWQNYIIVGIDGFEDLLVYYDISGIEINWEYEFGDDFKGNVFEGVNDFGLENESFTADGEEITEEEFLKKVEIKNAEEFFKELKEFIRKEIAKVVEANQEDFE